jgi:hypothetical protein
MKVVPDEFAPLVGRSEATRVSLVGPAFVGDDVEGMDHPREGAYVSVECAGVG